MATSPSSESTRQATKCHSISVSASSIIQKTFADIALAVASLALFERTLGNVDLATGTEPVTGTLATNGTAKATHTNSYVPLPSSTGASAAAGKAFRLPHDIKRRAQ